jgi:hypothetical protein
MAFAITVPSNASDMAGVPGNNKYVIKTCTFTGSYAAGSLTPTMLGFESIHIVIAQCESAGLVAQYDYTNETLDLYEAGADGAVLDEGNTAAGTVAVRIMAFGR